MRSGDIAQSGGNAGCEGRGGHGFSPFVGWNRAARWPLRARDAGSVLAFCGPAAFHRHGGNQAGNGGDGYFFGSLVNAPVVIYMPINIAIGGYNSSVTAEQSNTLQVDQSATQIAGVGGDGGNDNAAIGGSVSASGAGGPGSAAISTGDNHAGNGGDGFFYGSIVNASFVLYHPINIAVAGPNSTAHAEQTNTVDIDQSAFQMAGVGGNGGDGNIALGGDVTSSLGSGASGIDTGGNGPGNGGDGTFT